MKFKPHLIMALLFGIVIGIINLGIGLSLSEIILAVFGFQTICFITYKLFVEEK